jgi:hypothetical protein
MVAMAAMEMSAAISVGSAHAQRLPTAMARW